MFVRKLVFFGLLACFGIYSSLLQAESPLQSKIQLLPLNHQTAAVLTVPKKNGLFFYSNQTKQFLKLSPSAGKVYLSKNGGRLGLKWVGPNGKQAPIVFFTRFGTFKELPSFSGLTGVPSFSNDGKIAYSDGAKIRIADSTGHILKSIAIPGYANLTPISPNGKWVAYNDEQDQIWIVSPEHPERRLKLTDNRHGYFNPVWAHSSDKVLMQSIDGKIFVFDRTTHRLQALGEGTSPAWSPDDAWIVYEKPAWGANGFISDWDIAVVRPDGSEGKNLTQTPDVPEYSPVFLSDSEIGFIENGSFFKEKFFQKGVSLKTSPEKLFQIPEIKKARLLVQPEKIKKRPAPKLEGEADIIDIPYVHQVYDTPSWFDGYWACGATSAIMIIAYYKILPKWSLYVTQPFGHRTYFGRYICTVYTYNGHIFNIGSYDPLGGKAYGGYGFITQNNWADTKGYMAEYFQYHGLSSYVDWSPAWTDLTQEVDNARPFVLLNSLTSAGHYIDVVGYYDDRSVVVNDPYGDKNQDYVNYKGKQAVYDWPGYNNGHSNLNTVWCFIYAQKAPDLAADTLSAPDTVFVGDSLFVSFEVYNTGLAASDSAGVSVYLSANRTITTRDRLVSSRRIPGLLPGDTLAFSSTGRVPDDLPSGLFYAGLYIDPERKIPEGDRTNNKFTFPVVVKGLPTIVHPLPAPGSTTTRNPLIIEAHYSDVILGIDTTKVQLFVDSVEVTAAAEISSDGISYRVEHPANKIYSARLAVANKAGFSAQKKWQFRVDIAGSVSKGNRSAPQKFVLFQNYPNPFHTEGIHASETTIRFELAASSGAEIVIYNLMGGAVRRWRFGNLSGGIHSVSWNGRTQTGEPLASGIYLMQLTTPAFQATKQMVLLK